MKYIHQALGVGPLFYSGEKLSEEEEARCERLACRLLGITSLPEDPEAAQEARAAALVILQRLGARLKLQSESLRAQMAETEARMAETETRVQELFLEALIPHAAVGLKRRKQLKTFGDIHGKQKALAALKEHKPWIKEARSLWAKNRHLSVRRVAERVMKELGLPATKFSAVRKAIAAHKPTR